MSYKIIFLLTIIFIILFKLYFYITHENFINNIKLKNNLITYVIHYTPLKERKQFMLNEIDKHSLNYYFIEKYDREKLSDQDLKMFNTYKLKLSEVSLTRKHIDAYRKIVNNNYKYSLILEDDVILDDNFGYKLEKGLTHLPDDYDMLFIGNGANLHIEPSIIKPNQLIYKKCREPTNWGGNGGTRCTDSYLISKKCAKKLINYISKLKEGSIQMPSDWWLNQVIRDLQLEIYWMEPTIVTQGTETGKYNSSIR
jgi:GR25 family glycosyltransferase involved in LPS biosynthesis